MSDFKLVAIGVIADTPEAKVGVGTICAGELGVKVGLWPYSPPYPIDGNVLATDKRNWCYFRGHIWSLAELFLVHTYRDHGWFWTKFSICMVITLWTDTQTNYFMAIFYELNTTKLEFSACTLLWFEEFIIPFCEIPMLRHLFQHFITLGTPEYYTPPGLPN